MIDIFYKLTLSFSVISMLLFVWYSYGKNRMIFTISTIASIFSFLSLSIVLIIKLKLNYGLTILGIDGTRYLILSWVIMFIYYTAQYRYKIRLLGSIIIPVASMLIIMSTFSTGHTPGIPIQFSSLSTFSHVTLVFIGLGLLFLSFAASLLYLIKFNALKKHRASALDERLPSLPDIEKIIESTFNGGYPIFTLGLILGILYAGTILKAGWFDDTKIISGVINWSIYSILFLLKHTHVLKSRMFAKGIILLFIFISASFTFSKHEMLNEKSLTGQSPIDIEGVQQ